MTRAQLEHLIRACATIAEDDHLGQFPDAPGELHMQPTLRRSATLPRCP
jgi:hypothetical protein